MAERIGVRELKNRASEIVREVRESQATYVVTVRGEPAAEIRPLAARSIIERQREEEVAELMREVEELAQRIARNWRSRKTAGELLEEQRR